MLFQIELTDEQVAQLKAARTSAHLLMLPLDVIAQRLLVASLGLAPGFCSDAVQGLMGAGRVEKLKPTPMGCYGPAQAGDQSMPEFDEEG